MKKEPKNVLLTWHAMVHGVIVTARCINLLQKEQGIRISEVFYFQNADLTEKDAEEVAALSSAKGNSQRDGGKYLSDEMVAVVADLRDAGIQPTIRQKRVHLRSPADYDAIWKSMRAFLDTLSHTSSGEVQYHINLSPGTPQMHVIWLMLNSGGHLPNNTRLWSTQIDRTTNHTSLEEVKFKPKAYLSEVFEKKLRSQTLNDEASLSPLGKRGKAIDQLVTFAMVPNAPILVMGERGVGKSTVIKERLGTTKAGFVEIACGTFSDELFRSELFGHQKGSFSGAIDNKKGLIETVANGGILFLDEIQDLSKANQRLLLQVLQQRIYYPIGSTSPKVANFRIVAATNLSFSKLLSSDRLDLDFFDRISRFVVEFPALRDSPEDLPSIWKTTWQHLTSFDHDLAEITYIKVSPFLHNLPLHGNIRDLERIASLILVGKLRKQSDDVAIAAAFEEFERFEVMKRVSKSGSTEIFFEKGTTRDEILAAFNREFHYWAMQTYGTVAKAAVALGVVENTIRRMGG